MKNLRLARPETRGEDFAMDLEGLCAFHALPMTFDVSRQLPRDPVTGVTGPAEKHTKVREIVSHFAGAPVGKEGPGGLCEENRRGSVAGRSDGAAVQRPLPSC